MKKIYAMVAAIVSVCASDASATKVLYAFFGPGYDSWGNQMRDWIAGEDGADVTTRYLNQATYTDYDQFDIIWVYDLQSGGASTNSHQRANADAIGDWYNARTRKNIIADGRVLSSAHSTSETQLISNFYNALDERGGGLYLGTDHCGSFCGGINLINNRIEIAEFTGFYNQNYAVVDQANPLMANDAWTVCDTNNPDICYIYSNTSTSFAPAGQQDNGQFLTPVAYNTTDINAVLNTAYDLTAISASIGSITFGTAEVPLPALWGVFGVGAAFVGLRKAQR